MDGKPAPRPGIFVFLLGFAIVDRKPAPGVAPLTTGEPDSLSFGFLLVLGQVPTVNVLGLTVPIGKRSWHWCGCSRMLAFTCRNRRRRTAPAFDFAGCRIPALSWYARVRRAVTPFAGPALPMSRWNIGVLAFSPNSAMSSRIRSVSPSASLAPFPVTVAFCHFLLNGLLISLCRRGWKGNSPNVHYGIRDTIGQVI